MIKIKVIADDIRAEDAAYIIAKLKTDAEKHGYKIRTSSADDFTFFNGKGILNMISFDEKKSYIRQSFATGISKTNDKECEEKERSTDDQIKNYRIGIQRY